MNIPGTTPIVRVALVLEFGTLNGGERSLLAVLNHLAATAVFRGAFEFVALAPAAGPLADALRQRGIPHVPFERRDERDRAGPRELVGRRLLEIVRDVRPDVIHANSLSMGRLTGMVAAHAPAPCVAHLRDIIGLSTAAVADLNRNAVLVAVSQATRTFHVAQGLDVARVRVLYNGVDGERFQPRPAAGWLRRELGLPPEAFLVLTVGQIGLRKGQDVLAEAAAQAAPRLPEAHYLLVGERHSAKAESRDYERAVIERFERAELAGRLHRLGRREDVPLVMNECDLLAHPAHQEPLGRVLLEAGASGLPVIATAVGGTPEIFRDGESARLIPPGDSAALAAALVELHHDPARRRQFAAAARQRVIETFGIAQAAGELAALWREVAQTWPGPAVSERP